MLQDDVPLLIDVYSNVVQLEMNDAALAFFSETSKRALVERLHDDPPLGSLQSAAIMLAALDRGEISHVWINQCQPYPDASPRWIKETFYVPTPFRRSWERIIYTVQDVTDLKMTERNLERARLEADAANRAKSDFLANVSHEFRTPLHAIAGFSELLSDEELGPLGHEGYREYVRFIRDSGEHLLGLITDILDLSKYEAGELALLEDEVVLQEAVDAATRYVSDRAESLAIELRCDLVPEDAVVLADERKLKQILVNLLDNAVKFTAPGGCVALRGRPDESGGYIMVIEDNGIGIEQEDIPRVLERFGQTSSSREQGTGLGLPLARAFAELHGGSLTLESTPGVGTRVTVWLPAYRQIHPTERRTVRNRRLTPAFSIQPALLEQAF